MPMLFKDTSFYNPVWIKQFDVHIYEDAVNETLCANFKSWYQRSLCLPKYEIAAKNFSSYQTYKACNSLISYDKSYPRPKTFSFLSMNIPPLL